MRTLGIAMVILGIVLSIALVGTSLTNEGLRSAGVPGAGPTGLVSLVLRALSSLALVLAA